MQGAKNSKPKTKNSKLIILGGVLVTTNIIGLAWIHHNLTKTPRPTVRVLSALALPDADSADRFKLVFDRHMISEDRVGEVEKAAIFKLMPAWPGKWIWSARNEVEYILDKPLPPGRVFRINATEELRKRTGRVLDGDSEFSFETTSLALRRCELVASDEREITFRIVFNQPVDPGELLRHVSFYDKKTSSRLDEPVCLTKNPQEDLVVRFRRPQSNGFRMVLDERLVGHEAELGLDRPMVYEYQIPPGFSLLSAHAQRPGLDEIVSVRLRFSHKLSREQELPKPIVEPAVQEVRLHRSYRNLVVSGKFKPGRRYTIEVPGTMLSDDGRTLGEKKSITVDIPEYRPMLAFKYRQGILSPFGKLTVDLKAVNVEGIQLKGFRVHENNLVHHLQGAQPEATSRIVLDKTFEPALPHNEPQELALDLEGLLPEQIGVYRIKGTATNRKWSSDRALVTITDLAITAKAERGGSLVWVTSLRTGKPVPGARVKALTFNNQTLAAAETQKNGIARLRFSGSHPDGKMWVITAQKDNDLSYLLPKDNQWVLNDIKQAGRYYTRNYDVMLYAERGVYRPGDTIHLTGVIRENTGTVPPAFPLAVKVVRPDGRQVAELIVKRKENDQGVFHTALPTRSDSQTGPYRFRVTLPGAPETLGSTQTLVEAFVPVRMEVKAEPTARRFGPNEPPVIQVSGRYLWDMPAAKLPVSINGTLQAITFESREYPDFEFGPDMGRKPISLPNLTDELDENGKAKLELQLPKQLRAGLYRMWLSATVTEPGGRSVSSHTSVIIDQLDRYIGLRLPAGKVVAVGKPLSLDWVLLTGEDKPVSAWPGCGFLRKDEPSQDGPTAPGRMTMRLVRVEYDTVLKKVNNRRVWQSVERIKDVNSRQMTAVQELKGSFEVTCPGAGSYRVILSDEQSKTSTQLEFCASERTGGPQSLPMNQPERLELVTDKKKYLPGQTAKVLVPKTTTTLYRRANSRFPIPDCRSTSIEYRASSIEYRDALASNVCDSINNILSSRHRRPRGMEQILPEQVPWFMWKTGTSAGRRDAWAVGHNYRYAIGVWVGRFRGTGRAAYVGAEAAEPLLAGLFNLTLLRTNIDPPPSMPIRVRHPLSLPVEMAQSIRITSPGSGDTFISLDGKAVIHPSANRPDGLLWFLNGRLLEDNRTARLSLSPGHYELRCIDPKGQSSSVSFTVVGAPAAIRMKSETSESTKHEIRNPKQYRMTKTQMTKTIGFENLNI